MVGHTTVVFRGDNLIGQDPRVATWGVRFYRDVEVISRAVHPFDCYTVVTVSAETEPQRYTSVAICRYWVNHKANTGWLPRTPEPPLSKAQAKILREWLIKRSCPAWENATSEVKGVLGDGEADEPDQNLWE